MLTILSTLAINPNEPDKYYIGDNNKFIASVPIDAVLTRKYITKKQIILGHNTFKQIGPISYCTNIVLSSRNIYASTSNIIFVQSLNWEELQQSDDEYIIYGGQSVYELALPYATKLRLNIIELYPCDSYIGNKLFPNFNKYPWVLENISPFIKYNGHLLHGQSIDNTFVVEYKKP